MLLGNDQSALHSFLSNKSCEKLSNAFKIRILKDAKLVYFEVHIKNLHLNSKKNFKKYELFLKFMKTLNYKIKKGQGPVFF